MQHAYVVTEKIPGIENMPNVRDHDASVYLKLQGDALQVGGYETNPVFIEADGVQRIPKDFAFGLYELDYDVFGVHIEGAVNRVPCLEQCGIKSTVCGHGPVEIAAKRFFELIPAKFFRKWSIIVIGEPCWVEIPVKFIVPFILFAFMFVEIVPIKLSFIVAPAVWALVSPCPVELISVEVSVKGMVFEWSSGVIL